MLQAIISNWETATGRPIKTGLGERTMRLPGIASISPPSAVLRRLAHVPVTT